MRVDGADDAILDHVRRQAVQRALERVAGGHLLAVDLGLAHLPVLIVAQQDAVQLEHVRIVGEHDVSGVVDGEAGVLDRTAGDPHRAPVIWIWAIAAQTWKVARMSTTINSSATSGAAAPSSR